MCNVSLADEHFTGSKEMRGIGSPDGTMRSCSMNAKSTSNAKLATEG